MFMARKNGVIAFIIVVLTACAVLFGVLNQPEEISEVKTDGEVANILDYRYGSGTVRGFKATIGGSLSEQVVVAELAQKYDGYEISPEEREELEILLAQTDNDRVKENIRFILQKNDIKKASKTGVYRDMPDVPTVTIEPLMTPIYSRFDGYIKATRIGGDISESLFVYVRLFGARGTWDSIYIPAGESEYIHRDTMLDIKGDTVTYEIAECKQRSPECDYDANYSLCTPLTVACNIGNPSTATFHFASREEKPVVTSKPIKTPVSDPNDVAFEITRVGDISKYLSILLDCRTSSESFHSEPLSARALIPAGTRTLLHPYPPISAPSVTCYVGTSEFDGRAEESATVDVIYE